jgi:PAS domain S-box-containing protein
MEMVSMSETKLLVIDDESEIREVLSEVFQSKGYTVATAGTGSEAIDKAKETVYDVALIDMNLPDTDGTTLLKELKKGHPEMVCIIITGYASLQNTIEAFKDGASGYFVKPLKLEEVVHGVKEAADKQRLQRELRKSEERYRGLVEHTMDAIIGLDPDANVMSWNKGAEEMLGYRAEEVIGKSQFSLVPEELRDSYSENLGEAKVKGHVKEVETARKAKDGKTVPVEMTLTALNDDKGKHIGFVSILRDITERKQAEEKIKKYAEDLEERLNQLEEKGVSRYESLIKKKNSYLIKEKRYERSMAVFSNLIKFGLAGLCLTTKHPDVLKEMYRLKDFRGEFIWLSSSGGEENAINPSNLTAIHGKINEFSKNNANSIILFLGLEYIITLGGFEKTLKFLNSIIDAITINNSRLIIAIDPETLNPRELSLLENALIETKDDDLIRLGLE